MLNTYRKAKAPLISFLALLLASIFLVSCESDSLTDPNQFPMTLSGTLDQFGSDTFVISLSDETVLQFTVEDLEIVQTDPDATPPLVEAVGFRLGRNTTECFASTERTFIEGDTVLFSLDQRDYCIEIYDPGFIAPENETLNYSVFVQVSQ